MRIFFDAVRFEVQQIFERILIGKFAAFCLIKDVGSNTGRLADNHKAGMQNHSTYGSSRTLDTVVSSVGNTRNQIFTL